MTQATPSPTQHWSETKKLMNNIEHFAEILVDGGVVAFPTETVYGLGANAKNDAAVARIFEIKARPRFDPLIVHVSSLDMVNQVAASIQPIQRKLMEAFWPGPLTIIFPKLSVISDLVTAGLPTVAVRMPNHPVALELIRTAGIPVAAPSANPFGRTSPTTAAHVVEYLGDKVDGILDGGPCAVGLESTILSLIDGKPTILRTGGLAIEDIQAVIGPVHIAPPNDDLPQAPGRLQRHYAPATPMVLDPKRAIKPDSTTGLLTFTGRPDEAAFKAVEVLSRSGDLKEAASRLFAAIRRLDAMGLSLIVAEPVPDEGLGRAINDRLQRACKRG